MAKSPAAGNSESPVNRLLAERNQYTQWLGRLGVATDTAPDAVREKVRTDYEARLTAVVDELRQHTAQISAQLAEQRVHLEGLLARESEAQATLSEAELRHSVGEYDEAQWQKLRGETHRLLVTVREESGRVIEEIGRLDEVARLIASPVPAGAAAAPAPAPASAPAPKAKPAVPEPKAAVASAPDMELVDAEPGKGGKSGKAPRDSARTLFFPSGKGAEKGIDELDFLKSVASEQNADAKPAPSTRAAESAPKQGSAATVAASEPAPEAAPSAPRPSESAKAEGKTLKCAECGSMNRPTEWYCERCGAELAAL
ncbi:MAG: hypothetical protein ACHQXA_09610 [Gemmatimonadales bacterium]